jgi:phosphatidylglycerophosphatase A
MLDTIRLLAVTAGGAGLVRIAPGTCGSAVGLGVVALLPGDGRYPWCAGLAALAAAAGCIALGPWAERYFATKDPAPFVLDEVAGMLVATLAPERPPIHWCAAAFVLFRAFDIRKPFGIARLQRLPSGFGVLLDDLAAGVAALALGGAFRAAGALLA